MTFLAHAAPISYRFPIPIWIYVLGAGAVVALSAPAAAFAVRDADRPTRRSRNIYPPLRRFRLGPIGLVVSTVLFGFVLVGGLGGRTVQAREFFENPATVLVWVDFWVGLGLVSAFFGNIWDFVSPLSASARAFDRMLARRGVAPLGYPARLGQWPALGCPAVQWIAHNRGTGAFAEMNADLMRAPGLQSTFDQRRIPRS